MEITEKVVVNQLVQIAKDKEADKYEVAMLVKKSNRVLVTVSSHRFPFDFFPDTLNIEEGRIAVISRKFFLSSEIHSVDIKDISNVFINTAPFFAELVIVSKTFAKNEIKIKYLWKNEAVYVRMIVEGLRLFVAKNIDTSVYTVASLREKLGQLSTIDIVV